MFRPDDWGKTKKKIITERGMLPNQTEFPIVVPSGLEWDILKGQLFEAGADAILGGLKVDCQKHLTNPDNFKWVLVDTDGKSGCLVFIPEEGNEYNSKNLK